MNRMPHNVLFFRLALVLVFWGLLGLSVSQAEPVTYSNAFSVSWPDLIERHECIEHLKSQSLENGCFQLGEGGMLGVVFVTLHSGYALGSQERLEKHLRDSEEALSHIPRIHVLQSRVIKTEPLIGLMEIERRDGTLSQIELLRDMPIRQTSLLIPTGDKLAQIFIYLPMHHEAANAVYTSFMEEVIPKIDVMEAPVGGVLVASDPPSGALDLMPKALWMGGIFAAFVILLLSIASQIRRRQKKREDARMNAQIGEMQDFANDEISDQRTSEKD